MQLIFSGRHTSPTEKHTDSTMQLDNWELNRKGIVVDEKLGEGAFGVVYRGIIAETYNNSYVKAFLTRNGDRYVALKFLRGNKCCSQIHKTYFTHRGSFRFRET